ncbi:OLC1v1015805C1 [Oldenlandia corymbosa var. corymbosa]|uniref:OLC1v1015805C1 n=1 Tax=Oldenlandia corymbosa var. corymbosa TaxID=529605 RepID=A0AAV1E697_OLDCO|nr:OLC1v1015805C1 [Oldenlandia corymbosa var. corymbosa]
MISGFNGENEHDIAIVGGGIGGLATAIALHRKGFKDVAVYEKSDCLRAGGTAISISANGWRALDQLGVGDHLRDKANLIQGRQEVLLDQNRVQNLPFWSGEVRCLKRSDLINALADALPSNTTRFNCDLVSVQVVVGCDGSNSEVANFVGLKPASLCSLGSIRGLTNYPNGHPFPPQFTVTKRNKADGKLFGRFPIDDKLVYWFIYIPISPKDGKFPDDLELMKQATLRQIEGYPANEIEMVEKCEVDSLSFTRLRYRHPWEILVGKFRKGSVTVLGDAMHVMGPFLGQGGSATLEDAVVLARNMARKIGILNHKSGARGKLITSQKKIEEALYHYVKERKMRIMLLATNTYIIGLLTGPTPLVAKLIALMVLWVLFKDPASYDCGKL